MQGQSNEQDRPRPSDPAGPESGPADGAGPAEDINEAVETDQAAAAEPAVPAALSGTAAEAASQEKPAATVGESTTGSPGPGWWQRRSRLAKGVGAAATAVPPGGPRRMRTMLAALVAAGVIVGFGVGGFARAAVSSGPAAPSSAIPAPPRSNATFVEDDNLTAQDNQGNILQTSAPGLVRIISAAGITVGSGLVITPSGEVLTSNAVLRGAGTVTARYVLAGVTFDAKVIGTDPAADLALLQLEGHGTFPTVKLGNSADIAGSTYKSRQFSWHVAGEVLVTAVGSSSKGDGATFDVGNLIGLDSTATVGSQRMSGLLRTTAQVVTGQETGGPLVDLTGEVIGVDVAGTGSGLRSIGYAIPIDHALAVARQIQAAHA